MRLRMKFRNVERVLGVATLVLGITATAISYHAQVREEHSTSCQTQVNQEFLTVIKERGAIGNANTENINSLIQEVFTKGSTQQQIQNDYAKYLTELAVINGDLKRDTYPDIGSC